MAITNAQQYQQLVNKPANGKRPGYRGDDAARSERSYGRSSRADPGNAPRGDGPTSRQRDTISDENRRQQRQTNLPSTATAMDVREQARVGNTGLKVGNVLDPVTRSRFLDNARQRNIDTLRRFKDTKPEVNLPPFSIFNLIKGPLQKFSDWNTAGNRKFFENVIRAGKIPGLNFATVADMTDAELEQAFQDYMSDRLAGKTDAYGNPLITGDADPTRGNEGDEMIPLPDEDESEDQESEYVNPLSLLSPRIAGTQFAADGGRIGAMDGGIMSVEDLDREAFLLGGIAKGLKKAVRGVKKIAKAPLGKAALGFAALKFGGGLGGLKGKLFGLPGVDEFGGTMGLFGKLGLTEGFGGMMPTIKGGITLASILPLLVGKTDEEKDDILKEYYASQKLTPATTIRQAGSEFDFYNYNLAEGGTPRKEPVAKKVMPLLDMGGMEKDYRAEGGFVPIGRMEKADDVPARLSKNEFVFTADAVRNAGDGDVDKGAEVMYNMMKNLEAGGEVSKESQGLEGARKMFQTSQRLEEVL